MENINFKKILVIILMLMSIALLSSCSKKAEEDGPSTTFDNRPTSYGNTLSNIFNNPGQFAQDENYVYYFFEDDKKVPGLYKASFDFKDKTLISNISGSSLNISNNWIYYINEDDNRTIYKMDKDGKNNKKISDFKSVLKLMLIGDKLYFMSWDEGVNGIYVIDVDGNNLKQIVDLNVSNMYIYDNIIYFVGRQDDNYGIYKINMDGTSQTFLTAPDDKLSINNLLIYDDNIYYSVPNYAIFKVSIDGGEPEMIVDGKLQSLGVTINTLDNIMYYSMLELPKVSIYALNLDTNEKKLLIQEFANNIYIINNQIYFLEVKNNIVNYNVMNLDGSKLKKLWETKAVQNGWGFRFI